MNLTEVKDVLSRYSIIPSRKLGQNFLVDGNVARWIAEQLDLKADDVVVEVGPGTGALTESYFESVKQVILIEFDARLADYLTRRFEDVENVTVHHADGARWDVRQLFPLGEIKLLGNLPYSAGGAIMRNFLQKPSPVSCAVLMLQKEFIDRILAKERTKDYGVLTLRVQSEWVPKALKTVPPEAFHPRPAIDSTVMRLDRRKEDEFEVFDQRFFDELIRKGFAQRRKQVRKAMPEQPDWAEVAQKIDIIETARAEELSLEQWLEASRIYDPNPLKAIPQKDDEIFDVVDEDDQVIGQDTRAAVHAKELKHRAVHVLVFNKKKELFLQKRSRLKDVHPGAWDSSAAGHLDAGEDYESCVVRELKEELAIEDAKIQFVVKLPPTADNGWEFIGLYLARYDGAVRYPCAEVEAGAWFPLEIIREWISKRPEDFAGGFLECFAQFEREMANRDS